MAHGGKTGAREDSGRDGMLSADDSEQAEGGGVMEYGIKYDDIEKMVEIVKRDKVEVELTITPDNQTVVVRPWKPFTYACPYGRVE